MMSRLPLLPSSVAIAEGSLAQALPTMSMAGWAYRPQFGRCAQPVHLDH